MRMLVGATIPDGVPVVRAALRRLLTRLFGPPPFDPDRDPGDPGLTGPGSPSWRVIGEPAAIAGGIRGLLVQVAHPLAMAGVADHSAFRQDPLGRLQRTSAYVTTTTFGSTREALAVTERVRRAHRRVRGTAPDGRPYRADDPRLLAWVAVALSSSFLAAHQRWTPQPLSEPDADRFVAEQSRIAALLDPRVDLRAFRHDPDAQAELRAGRVELPMLEDGTLPRTVTELQATLAGFEPELGTGPQGREALAFLRRPPIPCAARGGYRALMAGAEASLEPALRRALGLPPASVLTRAAEARTGAMLTLMRTATGISPSVRAATARSQGAERTDLAA